MNHLKYIQIIPAMIWCNLKLLVRLYAVQVATSAGYKRNFLAKIASRLRLLTPWSAFALLRTPELQRHIDYLEAAKRCCKISTSDEEAQQGL